MAIAYYPGCSALGTSKEYEVSTQAILKYLGQNIAEIDDFSCCGSTPAHTMSHELSSALSARNLRLAADMKAEKVLTSCPSCLANLKTAKYRMADEEFKAEIDKLLDTPTEFLPESYSVLQYISEEVGLDKVKEKVTKPLNGLKVACYYGCLLTRPGKIMQFDREEQPMVMDNLLKALGAEVVDFPLKTECCGAAQGIPQRKMTSNLVGRILQRAKEYGVDMLVVACPLCQMNLDLRQGQAEKANNENFNLPVLYYTQLMGIAFDLAEESIMLKKLIVDPSSALAKIQTPGVQQAKEENKSNSAEGAA